MVRNGFRNHPQYSIRFEAASAFFRQIPGLAAHPDCDHEPCTGGDAGGYAFSRNATGSIVPGVSVTRNKLAGHDPMILGDDKACLRGHVDFYFCFLLALGAMSISSGFSCSSVWSSRATRGSQDSIACHRCERPQE